MNETQYTVHEAGCRVAARTATKGMNSLAMSLTLISIFLIASSGRANFCAQDAVPAATLLIPYVEVTVGAEGLPDPDGQTTISHITNVGRNAVIVHFTVWDLAGIARFCFDEVLSGYDALQINWRDVVNGRGDLFDTSRSDFTASTPLTRDPFEWGPDGRSQSGGLSVSDNRSAISAAQCPGPPPYGDRSDLAPTIRMLLSGSQVARAHLSCEPWNLRTDVVRFSEALDSDRLFFYVTADVVTSCSSLFPSQPEYWGGVAGNANVLTGEVIYLNARKNTSEMVSAAHIEAATATQGGGPSVFGFYEEKNGGIETNREPLATAFMFPYANDPIGGLSSSVIVWKNFAELDTTDDPTAGVWGRASDCGSYLYYAWDMDERSLSRSYPISDPGSGYPIDPNQFAFSTQRVPLTNSYFDLPDHYGWLLLVLPPSYGSGFVDPTVEDAGYLTREYMGWAAVVMNYGTYSSGVEAVTMANGLCFPGQALPGLGANDGVDPIR